MKHSLLLLAFLMLSSCTPQAKTVEVDLCKARAEFKLLEAADPSLMPKPGGIRERIEIAEDALCLGV